MIGKIAGRLEHRGSDHVLIDVGGVGYVVHVSERTLAALPGPGEAVALYTELLVREDLLQLVGFPSLAEKEWHRLLTSVQGVGARVALAILGTLGPEGVARAVALGDWGAVRAVPGIGPKIAQRLVNELKDKAPAAMAMESAPPPAAGGGGAGGGGVEPPSEGAGAARAEALSALLNLGYAQGEAAAAVARSEESAPEASTAELIRLALRRLAPAE